MAYLRIFNWALFLFNTMMAVVLSVVALMLWVYREEAAELGSHLAPVVVSTGLFAVMALIAGGCVWAGRRRHWLFLWPLEGILLMSMALVVAYFRSFAN
jgi:hypothetical protein